MAFPGSVGDKPKTERQHYGTGGAGGLKHLSLLGLCFSEQGCGVSVVTKDHQSLVPVTVISPDQTDAGNSGVTYIWATSDQSSQVVVSGHVSAVRSDSLSTVLFLLECVCVVETNRTRRFPVPQWK